jgi:zinc protease
MPPVAAPADPKFPEVTKATLPNGLRIVVARRAESPLVRLDLLVDAGFAADPADAPGTARLAGSLLTDGTASKNALELRRAIDSLGAELNVTTATDTTQLTLSGLRASLGPSLKLLADVALHPAFPADALETRRRAQLAEVEREGVDARGMVQRVLPRLLYGEGHPYAQPGSGTGTRDAVKKLSRDDLAKFHGAWFRPGSTTLVATGDLTAADLAPLAASAFAGWEAGAAPAKSLPAPGAGGSKSASRVFLLDRPGAPQSVVLAAQLVPARGGPEETPLEIVHTVLGGSFISRINMNLREDKHWSYGARSDIRDTRGLRVLSVSAGVQTDKTAESLAEVVKEVRRISGTEPPTADEIAMAKSQMTLTLPGRWESSRSVAESLTEMVVFGLPDGWFDGYAARVRAVTPEQVSAATKQIRPESVVWVVVGDRKRVEAGVRALGVGEVTVIDADGKPAE